MSNVHKSMGQSSRGVVSGCLGNQRATPAAAARAASRLVDAPMAPSDVVREMTGANDIEPRKLAKAWSDVQQAMNDLSTAKDTLELRLQIYVELADQQRIGMVTK